MRRLAPGSFGVLVVATVAAFFIVQHLKVTLPLINGDPLPLPAAFNPLGGARGPGEPAVCRHRQPTGRLVAVDYRQTFVTFYLQHQAAHVRVDIVTGSGRVVRTLVRDYYMPLDRRNPRGAFVWNGRENDGRIAPAGVYYYRVTLRELNRSVLIDHPVTIITAPPRPRVRGVHPASALAGASVRVSYAGARGDRNRLLIYRQRGEAAARGGAATGGGRAVLVKSFAIPSERGVAVWNGLIGGAPAPAGTYLLALRSIDPACNTGTYPSSLPPAPGSAPVLRVLAR